MPKPEESINLEEVLRFMKAAKASYVRLRVGEPPRLFYGSREISADFPVIQADRIRPLIYAVCEPEQIRQHQDQGILAMTFRLKGLGEIALEAYYRDGVEEALLKNPECSNPDDFFGPHGELAEAARQNPLDADVYWNLGVKFLQAKEYQQALHAFEKADTCAPSDTQILTQIGTLKSLRLCRWSEAVKAFEKAIACEPPLVESFVGLAKTHFVAKHFDEGKVAAERGLRQFPDHPLLLEALSACLMKTGGAEQAVVLLQKILDMSGSDPDILHLQAQAYREMGRHPDAIDKLLQALALQPAQPLYLEMLGQLYNESNRIDEAREAFKRCLAVDPENFRARIFLTTTDDSGGR